MLVMRQHRICRKDLKANPDILYIFGDNLDRQGLGGQAGEMRGEPNAFGIATKRTPGSNYPNDYFLDKQSDVIPLLEKEFLDLLIHLGEKNPSYKAIVIPLDGIGTGLSEMPKYAPKALEFINLQLTKLKGI